MKGRLPALTLAATYIGTVVGAGFASGQEVLQFFGYFGWPGLLAIGLAVVLFAFFGHAVMVLGCQLEVSSYQPVILLVAGRWLGGWQTPLSPFPFWCPGGNGGWLGSHL